MPAYNEHSLTNEVKNMEAIAIPYSAIYTDSDVSPEMREACGLIPEFFARAVAEGADTLNKVCSYMSDYYGFGNSWNFDGTITAEGVYVSPYEDDEDLEPLGHWTSNTGGLFDLFVYPYGMCAVGDPSTGETKITRMD
jgi:hypothetical protein